MKFVEFFLITFLIVCAVAVALTKNLLTSIVILSSYSLVMSVIWMLLESPDLAITEAAVGAGVTSVLFYITLRRIHAIDKEDEDEEHRE
jgi:energy-converting hydrogenase B subunit D